MWSGLFILALGVFFVVGGVHTWRQGSAFGKRAVRAQGTVVELRYSAGVNGGRGTYAPVLEFRTQEGQPVRVESQSGDWPPVAQVGEVVPVLYDPNDPSSAVVDRRDPRDRFLAAGLIGVGGIAAIVGAFVLAGSLG